MKLSLFERYLLEAESVEEVEWSKPLYHGTSLNIAKKIVRSKQFAVKDSGGVNETGKGVYLHPSMNRTSPWVHLSSKGKDGAFIKLEFKRPLKLAVLKRGVNQRELTEQGYDGIYDKNGNTQVPHQVMLFNLKPIGMNLDDLHSNVIDWSKTTIIPFDSEKHDYLNADTEERKYYF
jgi:hypothetical protein